MTDQQNSIPDQPETETGFMSIFRRKAGREINITEKLLDDVGLLAQHGVRTGRVPADVSFQDIYNARIQWETKGELSPQEIGLLVEAYQKLQSQFANVTPDTLSATTPEKEGKMQTSPAGRYLFKLWITVIVMIVMVLLSNFLQFYHDFNLTDFEEEWEDWDYKVSYAYQFSQYMEPFVYGTLGALAHMLRVTARTLRDREFDPSRAPEHINRIILGTLSGGAIILFIAQITDEDGQLLQISAAALGFIAGYSVDFLFQTIDRIVEAILPQVGLSTVQLRQKNARNLDLLAQYRDLLNTETDAAKKELLKDVVSDLKRL
ncbi:hypothetical protein ROLI_031290 [Roseobacter fucihabitans]|uniref:Uncharacterized protein n=1 Tax=Roseobacter fucihabitans TaxID=1537242 RepID=A0ABZ2BXD3_9RHOB|nr:hypothetical protein [Roseobacter litoralis]MBC6968060.1 hypothetical protein [Roseobacter litoralis]